MTFVGDVRTPASPYPRVTRITFGGFLKLEDSFPNKPGHRLCSGVAVGTDTIQNFTSTPIVTVRPVNVTLSGLFEFIP